MPSLLLSACTKVSPSIEAPRVQTQSGILRSTWADSLSSPSEICHSLDHKQLPSTSSHWAHLAWHLGENRLLCHHSQFPRPREGKGLVKETAWNVAGYCLQKRCSTGKFTVKICQTQHFPFLFLFTADAVVAISKFCTITRRHECVTQAMCWLLSSEERSHALLPSSSVTWTLLGIAVGPRLCSEHT